MVRAIFPATFDPIHYGHMDIAERAARLFDEMLIAVYDKPLKSLLFSPEERIDLVRQSFKDHPKIRVVGYSGLTINMARENNAQVIVRGLRVFSDFEFEFRMALANHRLAKDVETVAFITNEEHTFISSTTVRESCPRLPARPRRSKASGRAATAAPGGTPRRAATSSRTATVRPIIPRVPAASSILAMGPLTTKLSRRGPIEDELLRWADDRNRPRGSRGASPRGRSLQMVEAVGIEPTSGNPQQQASTSIADFLQLSLPGPPIGGISRRPAPNDLVPHPGARLGTSHQNMTPVPGP